MEAYFVMSVNEEDLTPIFIIIIISKLFMSK